jgi:hypothetical protein
MLDSKSKTHGKYSDVSTIAQTLKDIVRSSPNWLSLTDKQAESLEMICSKISRIVSGDPSQQDHWVDVAGYALLAIDPHERAELDNPLAIELQKEVDKLIKNVEKAVSN